MKTTDAETCKSTISSSNSSQRLRQLELELKKAEVKRLLFSIEIQLRKVIGEERSSRSSLLSRNETVVEKISRWKRSFPEQNKKNCGKSNDNQSQGTPDDMNIFHNHENQNDEKYFHGDRWIVKINLNISPKKKIVEMVVWDLKSS
jgi:hypothetical protein